MGLLIHRLRGPRTANDSLTGLNSVKLKRAVASFPLMVIPKFTPPGDCPVMVSVLFVSIGLASVIVAFCARLKLIVSPIR